MEVNNCRNPLIKSGMDPDIKNIAHSFLRFVVPTKSPNAQNKKKNGNQFIRSTIARLLFQDEK